MNATQVDELRAERQELIRAMIDAEQALAKAKSALEHEARRQRRGGFGLSDRLRAAIYDANEAWEQAVMTVAKYTTTNA